MKKILVCSFYLFVLSPVLFAQIPCVTQMDAETINWLKAYKQSHPGAPAHKSAAADSIVWIPLKVHSVATNAGLGYYHVDQILDMLCNVNSRYIDSLNWQFYLYGGIDFVASTELDSGTNNYQQDINNLSVPNVVNVFFVSDPSGACGYYYPGGGPADASTRSGYQGFVAINKSCAGSGNTTVAHELGHYFSLLHPFNGWESRNSDTDPATFFDERVDESNCSTAGDYMCDTRADYINYRWYCPYTGTKKDYNGDTYNPDGTLYMGYSIEPCATRFSAEQVDAMKAYLPSKRSYTTAIPHSVFAEITDTAKVRFPLNNVHSISPNYAQLIWTPVPGATMYSVETSTNINFTVLNLDTIVSDTSLVITNLQPNLFYHWRVRAFNPGRTCSPYTPYNTFKTDGIRAVVPTFSVLNVGTCYGDSSGSATVSITGGHAPYSYQWSNGHSGSYAVDLKAGVYTVTITDSTNNSVVLAVSISQPQPLNVAWSYSGTAVVANVAGGTPQYTYMWSNGATTASLDNVPNGNYSVTVTDNKGCTDSASVLYSDIQELSGIQQFNVYPNPLAGNHELTVDINAIAPLTSAIELYDITGRRLYYTAKNFTPGNNKFNISLADLATGIYTLKIGGNNISLNRKVVVY